MFNVKIRNAMRASIVKGQFKAGVLRNIVGTNTYWKICDCFGSEQAFIEAAQQYVDEGKVKETV